MTKGEKQHYMTLLRLVILLVKFLNENEKLEKEY